MCIAARFSVLLTASPANSASRRASSFAGLRERDQKAERFPRDLVLGKIEEEIIQRRRKGFEAFGVAREKIEGAGPFERARMGLQRKDSVDDGQLGHLICSTKEGSTMGAGMIRTGRSL